MIRTTSTVETSLESSTYDLRHTCATLLLASGEHPKVVAERLGHSSTVVTMDVYSHVLPDLRAVADELEKSLCGSVS